MLKIKYIIIFLALHLLVSPSTAHAKSSKSKTQKMDDWIQKSLTQKRTTRQVSGGLLLQRFKDPVYILRRPITWRPNDPKSKLPSVIVPAGFVTDFASVPRVFWSVLRPDGEYVYAAIIHDYLYGRQTTTRKQADDIFLAVMKDFKISWFKRNTIYRAVRADVLGLGGGSVWRDIAGQPKKESCYILKKFPTKPTISWLEWKKEPTVYKSCKNNI